MSNAELMAEALGVADRFLDVDQRAWVIAIGRHHDRAIDVVPDDELLRRILDSAYATGHFPTGAFEYVAHDVEIVRGAQHSQILMQAADPVGAPYLECIIGFGTDGFLGVAMTRSGHLDDGPATPGHVLLCDVESVLLDAAILLDVYQGATGVTGDSTVSVMIASAVPDSPLRLRALDEETGALAPALPAGPAQDFTPVSFDIHTDDDVETSRRKLYQSLTQAAVQFGVSKPQLLGDPDRHPADYERQAMSARRPAACGCTR